MSKVAQADVVVERTELRRPSSRAVIRRALYEALGELGRVDSIDRYVANVPDGPLKEQPINWDRFTIVRVIGRVTPRRTGGST